jgi:periplasmic protein TonB
MSNPADLVATRADRGNVANLQGVAAVAPRDEFTAPFSPAADLSNVVPFARLRRGPAAESSAPQVVISPTDRLAPLPPGTKSWPQPLLLTVSLIVHGGVSYLFWQEPQPQPLPGIAIEAISIEVVVGDNRPAGSATAPGESPIESSRVDEGKPNETPVEKTELDDVRAVKPDDARPEFVGEQAAERPKEQQPEERQKIAMVETPHAAEIPTVRPRETPPDVQAVIAPPRERPKGAKHEPKAKQKKAEQPSPEARVASGSGRIAVASLANYNGQVSAHLRRYQRYPAAAEKDGVTGGGIVSFTISGSGSVTSARVARGTGAAVLDQEMTAMVQRASPFPAPPDGQAKSFSVPLHFTSPK